MISSGSASAAITINSEMPLFRVLVAGKEVKYSKHTKYKLSKQAETFFGSCISDGFTNIEDQLCGGKTLNFYTLKTLYEGKFMWDVWGVNQMVFYTAFFYIGVDGLEGMLYLL